jgi:hypothetical protein
MTDVKIGPRAKRIVAAGEAMASTRWQSALSRSSGVGQSYLASIASGGRPVTDEVEDKVVLALAPLLFHDHAHAPYLPGWIFPRIRRAAGLEGAPYRLRRYQSIGREARYPEISSCMHACWNAIADGCSFLSVLALHANFHHTWRKLAPATQPKADDRFRPRGR